MRPEYSVRRPIPSRCHMKPASSPSSPGRCGERFLGPPAAVWVPRTPRPRNPPSAPKPTAAKRAPDGIGEAGLLHDLDAASHVAGPGFGQPDEVTPSPISVPVLMRALGRESTRAARSWAAKTSGGTAVEVQSKVEETYPQQRAPSEPCRALGHATSHTQPDRAAVRGRGRCLGC
jgi:hypothetical protein